MLSCQFMPRIHLHLERLCLTHGRIPDHRDRYTLTTADLAIAYTIANSVVPITMTSGGWFRSSHRDVDRWCHVGRWHVVVRVRYKCWGIDSYMRSWPWHVSSCIKFSPDKRGLIGGITTAVYGFSSVALPPVVAALVQAYNRGTGVSCLLAVAGLLCLHYSTSFSTMSADLLLVCALFFLSCQSKVEKLALVNSL